MKECIPENAGNAFFPMGHYHGESMFPGLRDGDVLLIKRMPSEEISRWSIIVYEYHGVLAAHRVVRTPSLSQGSHFVTVGDFNGVVHCVDPLKVRGVLKAIVRQGDLKEVRFENSIFFYLLSRPLFWMKLLARFLIERALRSAVARRALRRCWPLPVSCARVVDEAQDRAFEDFYSADPFKEEDVGAKGSARILAMHKGRSVGKVWVMDRGQGTFKMCGPYVRAFCRARSIGSSLVEAVVEHCRQNGGQRLQAVSKGVKALGGLLIRFGFSQIAGDIFERELER